MERNYELGRSSRIWWAVAIFVVIVLALAGLWGIGAKAEPYQGQIPTNDNRFIYKAVVERVIDGDTVVMIVSLGFNIRRIHEHIRLARIDAPETRGTDKKRGLAAKRWLEKKILGKKLIVKTIKTKKDTDKRGSFGRYLGEIFFGDENINDALVKAGHAVYRK